MPILWVQKLRLGEVGLWQQQLGTQAQVSVLPFLLFIWGVPGGREAVKWDLGRAGLVGPPWCPAALCQLLSAHFPVLGLSPHLSTWPPGSCLLLF